MRANEAPMPVEVSPNFQVRGVEIGFEHKTRVQAQGEALIASSAGEIVVDLGELERANSVTVSVLLGWYRAAQRENKSIVFVNLSKELRNIVTFSGLADVLGV